MRRKLLGDERPAVAVSLGTLAEQLREKGDYVAAEPLYREAVAVFVNTLPAGHGRIIVTQARLAHRRTGKRLRCTSQ